METQTNTLEQALQAYRTFHTPAQLSWKQHWVNENFSHDTLCDCTADEQQKFSARLMECGVTIFNSIKQTEGGMMCTLQNLVNIISDPANKDVQKIARKVIYPTSNGERPIGKKAFELWNGFQVIDMDIKDRDIAMSLKQGIFDHLKKYNWFLGVVLSSSGKGLHIYTKIQVSQSEQEDSHKKKLLYLANFRHKYSFVYLACLKLMKDLNFTQEQLVTWMDLAMFKPQQGAFIGYDERPLFSTHFFEDFIYVSFDNVEDVGHPNIDWVTYPDLKEIFKRWEWFEDKDDEDAPEVRVVDCPELEVDAHNKVHYKHNERWRLANTLVKIYGQEKGYQYLRMICSNVIKDKELQADCITAARHEKPVDVWAVNRLNSQHGFKIKLDVPVEETNLQELYSSIEGIENPNMLRESKHTKTFHITSKQYLGNIKYELLENAGMITLIEAGAGVGKTEMVKSLVRDGKRIMMVMPFTSTIKSKVEKDKDWEYAYGSKKVKFDDKPGLALTIDKFSHLNMMEIKSAGFDYIFIDESHLLFQSEYRPVMPKVIDMIAKTEVPIILMSGTPIGETVFFDDIVHLRVIKDDVRKKEFNIKLVDSPSDVLYHMARYMAQDIAEGRRILFPTNKGTLYSYQVEAAVNYFLQNDHQIMEPVVLHYYKKANVGEQFMDDINFEKVIKDTQILMCSSYLSVGVDILDRYQFSVYFNDLWLAHEVEQFANRLRANDLYINMFISKSDGDGNSRNLSRYKKINMRLNDDEIKHCHSIIRICNNMIERNPIEYRYNSLIASIIEGNKFVEYNEIENKYYLNETAYKVIYFERKYREYAQQLPVLAKGMMIYGYQYSSQDLGKFVLGTVEEMAELQDCVSNARTSGVEYNTTLIDELMNRISENNLEVYRDVLASKYDIRKGDKWSDIPEKGILMVKSVEIFEKVIPLFLSMSKLYRVEDVKSIFKYCQENGVYNFSAIKRIKLLINIIYNGRIHRLDLPVESFVNAVDKFVQKEVSTKSEIAKFISDFATDFATNESNEQIIITRSPETMKNIIDTYTDMFKCLVETETKKKQVHMKRAELIWTERRAYDEAIVRNTTILQNFMELEDIKVEDVDAPF